MWTSAMKFGRKDRENHSRKRRVALAIAERADVSLQAGKGKRFVKLLLEAFAHVIQKLK